MPAGFELRPFPRWRWFAASRPQSRAQAPILTPPVAGTSGASQEPGSISGTVLDQQGNPVERAAIQPYDGVGMPIHLRTVHTDHMGHFVIYTMHPGEWELLVSKVEDGYPDPVFDFGTSRTAKPVKVTVKPGASTTGIELHLGPKAAFVHLELFDADTNRPLGAMMLDMQATEPGQQAQSNGEWLHARRRSPADLLIAPGLVRLTVTSPGYLPWTAEERNHPYLSLRSGEHREFKIKLHPRSDRSDQPAAISPATPKP